MKKLVTCVWIHASLWHVKQILTYNTTLSTVTNFFSFFVRNGLAHVRVAKWSSRLLNWAAASPTFCLQPKSERLRLLIFGFYQLPCLVSVLASLLEWVDFLMNRVLIFPERVYAFPHLRKSIISKLPATIISKAGGLWFPVLAPYE